MPKSERTCVIPQCTKPHVARGWCRLHYGRWHVNGDPLVSHKGVKPPLEERFLAKLERQGECLIWTGGQTRGGYGSISADGKKLRVHRLAYEREYGPIPQGMEVDHTCHARLCCEPTHLRLATRPQNCSNLSGARRDSATGVRNVTRNGSGFAVNINCHGKRHYLGTYRTLSEAAEVARTRREELFGEFAGAA